MFWYQNGFFRRKYELPVPFLEINGSSVRRRITEKGFYLAVYAIVVARNKMVINVQFKAVLVFHKHTVILPDKTCVANCIQ